MKLKESEKDIQKAILDDLMRRKAVEIKFNNVGILKENGKYIPPRQLGVSDILACYKGRFLAIEVKSSGKKATENQELFINRVNHALGFGICVDSIDKYLLFMKYVDSQILKNSPSAKSIPADVGNQ